MLADGVWLNLPEETYFAQKGRRGSTDWCRLYLQKEGWWWSSDLNPDKVEQSDESRGFGKALHARGLEGENAYRERFAVVPDREEERARHGAKFCVTVDDIVNALAARDFHPSTAGGKAKLIEYCKTRAPDLVIWDSMVEKFKAANKGKTMVSTVEDRQLAIMVDAMRNHPEIGALFQYDESNVPLAEVSILWHDEWGIPRRARLDQMQPQTTIDVKAMSNVGGRPLAFAVGEHLAKYAYHVQMADHHIARNVAYRFITEGKVFDGFDYKDEAFTEDQRKAAAEKFKREAAWIKRFPAEAPSWDYAWIFYQRPDAKDGRAPVVFPWAEDYWDGTDSGQGELHLRGIRCRRQAIETYRRCMNEFGPNKPWTRVEPVHTTTDGAPNRVFVPPYVGGDEFVAGEAEDA